MPIYGYGLVGAPWVRETKIEIKKFYKLVKIINQAKQSFDYSNDEVFCRSIKVNQSDENYSYIAVYDKSKTGIDESTYIFRLEVLINEANLILSKNKKFENYKFDIMGYWTVGQIIIMKKN